MRKSALRETDSKKIKRFLKIISSERNGAGKTCYGWLSITKERNISQVREKMK